MRGVVDFQPIPKRFMVWDKEAHNFVKGVNGYTLNWREIANLVEPTICDCPTELDELTERFVIVQSTNLFDKDGKEIFEGSIIRDKHYMVDGKPLVAVVVPHREIAAFTLSSIADEPSNLVLSAGQRYEVIGHILSNPELLEGGTMKVSFNITKWPSGYGLDIETEKHIYGFAGACGGGVGTTEATLGTSRRKLEKLREIIDGVLEEPNE